MTVSSTFANSQLTITCSICHSREDGNLFGFRKTDLDQNSVACRGTTCFMRRVTGNALRYRVALGHCVLAACACRRSIDAALRVVNLRVGVSPTNILHSQFVFLVLMSALWIPACAGMTCFSLSLDFTVTVAHPVCPRLPVLSHARARHRATLDRQVR